jgi:CubicO group peptidase (beta-lactamase class C family)
MLALKRVLSALLFVLLLPVLSQAQSIGYANPEDVGFSRQSLDRISETLNGDIAKGMIPGSTLLIVRNGKIAYFQSFGWLDAAAKTPMPKDAIFRTYSMSPAILALLAAPGGARRGSAFIDFHAERWAGGVVAHTPA